MIVNPQQVPTLAKVPSQAEPQPAVNDGMRLWTDDTGSFQVRARLVDLLEGKVRLLKDTGRYTTVSLQRLSANDLSYVQQQAQLRATAGSVTNAAPLHSAVDGGVEF